MELVLQHSFPKPVPAGRDPAIRIGKNGWVYLTFEGEELTLPEWARKVGLSRNVLFRRVVSSKWPVSVALRAPANASRAGGHILVEGEWLPYRRQGQLLPYWKKKPEYDKARYLAAKRQKASV